MIAAIGASTLAQLLDSLQREPDGMVIHGLTSTALVRDSSTPANNFNDDINDLLTYSSPSTKYVRNASGILVPGTTLRTDHDADGNALGLLIEEQRTNLFLYSDQFDNAVWTASGGGGASAPVVTPNAGTAPDGTNSADRVQFDLNGTTGSGDISQLAQTIAYTGGQPYTETIWLKSYDGSEQKILLVNVNVQSSEITVTDQWQRFEHDITPGSSVNSAAGLRLRGTASSVDTADVLVWRGNLQAGFFPSSDIKTEGSTVTRAADDISLATSKFPFADEGDGTLIFASQQDKVSIKDGAHFVNINDGTSNNRIVLYTPANDATVKMFVADGGVTQTNNDIGELSDETLHKVGFAWAVNDFQAALDSVLNTQDTLGTLPSLNDFHICRSELNQSYINGHLSYIKYLPRRITNAELQSETS